MIRVLCLGNDLLSDDAFGIRVAHHLRTVLSADLEVVDTIETGFALVDALVGADHMVVVDTIVTGNAPPGTIYQFGEADIQSLPGGSPHYVGILEPLALARRLGLTAPDDLVVIAVEGDDVRTVGGPMSPDVEATIPRVTALVQETVASFADSPCMMGGHPCA